MIRANSEEKVWDPQGSMAHISLGGNFLAKEVQLSTQGWWEGKREVTDSPGSSGVTSS